MAVTVLLPSLLAAQAGRDRFELEAPTVGAALRTLPIADLLFDERGELRPLVNVYVNRTQVDGLDDALGADDEIRLVAAVAGG